MSYEIEVFCMKNTFFAGAEKAGFYDDEVDDELQDGSEDPDAWLDWDEDEGPLTPEQQAEMELIAQQIRERNAWLSVEVQRHPGGDWYPIKILGAKTLEEARAVLDQRWANPPFDVRL